MKIQTIQKEMLADLTTPVSLFLKLREQYAEVLLLESSDYSSKENSLSFICCDSLATLSIKDHETTIVHHTNNKSTSHPTENVVHDVNAFVSSFDGKGGKFSGVFGYTDFDAVQYFDTITFDREKSSYDTPQIRYDFFRYVIVFDHFYGRLSVVEHIPDGQEATIDQLVTIINKQTSQTYHFSRKGELEKNMSDEAFKSIVSKCKAHCHRGDVFQIVPSRRFAQAFSGDEFNVYRALRSINPSPYLFYFDYGSYKIFGSSPEAQIIVKQKKAEIHPIAGTFRRTGNDIEDAEIAKKLAADPKENAEHTMLVDLARNDLSKNTSDVHVEKLKEIQYFSHVIHLVSVVKGSLNANTNAYQILADTFPAGTLSGAPKYKALELIDQLEPTARGYYGGGIGMIGLNGELNHAIMIRSFFSYEGKLYCQAGAGIVIDSNEQSELEEVNNKLAALMQALQSAENL